MGWTSQHANYYKNGTVDKLEECRDLLTCSSEKGFWKPIKMALVGSTVYAAVERVLPNGDRYVYGEVILTKTNMRDYYDFSYKDMDETSGPYKTECPIAILNLLTPTDNENAKKWREDCYEYHRNKANSKKDKNSLNNLPVGSVIEMPYWNGGTKTLTKCNHYSPKTIWTDGCYRYTTPTIKRQGYTVIKRGDE